MFQKEIGCKIIENNDIHADVDINTRIIAHIAINILNSQFSQDCKIRPTICGNSQYVSSHLDGCNYICYLKFLSR